MVRAAGFAILSLCACRFDADGLGTRAEGPAAADALSVATDTAVADSAAGDIRTPPKAVPLDDVSPPECADGVGVDGHCYFSVEDARSWYDARDECAARGAHLATVTTARELETLKPLGKGDRWLGLRKGADAGVFAWITGEGFSLDGWKPGEPNGTGSCGKMVESGEWLDHSCLEPLPALCERD